MSLKTKVVVHCESHTEILISFFNATTNCEECWIGKLANIHFVCYFKTSINEKIHMKKKTDVKLNFREPISIVYLYLPYLNLLF